MHIAFVNLPHLGHLNPTLEVVRELIGRGHRVTYPTTAQRNSLVQDTGASVPGCVSTIDADAAMPPREQWMTHMRDAMLAETAKVLPQLLSIFAADRPDLVVHDRAAFSGRMLAAKLGVPTVQTVPSFASNKHWAVTERFAPIDPTSPEHAAYRARLAALLTEYDVDWEALPTPACQVVFLPRAFQYAQETFGDAFHFVGPCLRPSTSDWHPRGDKTLLISMGSLNNHQPGFYRTCINVFENSPWQVVMAVGSRWRPSVVPPNFDVMPFVPQLEVLAHASAMLCHGGMGSVMEALHFGVPLVLTPLTPEQEANAARVEELGLGVRLSDYSGTKQAVDFVANDHTIASNLRRMRSEILACGGAAAAADAIGMSPA